MASNQTPIWTEAAIDDLEHITQYIALENWLAAIAMQDRIEAKANQLPAAPRADRIGRMPGTREMVVHPNYVVVYRETTDSITILRDLHAAQSWP